MYTVACGFLAGLYVPVTLFPAPLLRIDRSLPFPGMLQSPIDVISGHVTGAAALHEVLAQVVWVAALAVAGQLVLRAGRRRLEVQGG